MAQAEDGMAVSYVELTLEVPEGKKQKQWCLWQSFVLDLNTDPVKIEQRVQKRVQHQFACVRLEGALIL